MTENNIIFVVGRRGLVGLFVILYYMSTHGAKGPGIQFSWRKRNWEKCKNVCSVFIWVIKLDWTNIKKNGFTIGRLFTHLISLYYLMSTPFWQYHRNIEINFTNEPSLCICLLTEVTILQFIPSTEQEPSIYVTGFLWNWTKCFNVIQWPTFLFIDPNSGTN